MSDGSIKTLVHDSRLCPAVWSRNFGPEGQRTERETGNTARGVAQVSNFTTDVIKLGDFQNEDTILFHEQQTAYT
jgi:hypothetical protein